MYVPWFKYGARVRCRSPCNTNADSENRGTVTFGYSDMVSIATKRGESHIIVTGIPFL